MKDILLEMLKKIRVALELEDEHVKGVLFAPSFQTEEQGSITIYVNKGSRRFRVDVTIKMYEEIK